MDAITLPQFKKTFAEQRYKYLSMYDMNNSQIVARNSGKTTSRDKLAEIEKRMKTQPDNYFLIHATNSYAKTVKPDVFCIVKDPTLSESAPTTITIQEAPAKKEVSEGTNVRSYEYVLELEKTVNRLELENQRLEEKVQELEDQLDNAPALDEGGGFLSEKTMSFIETTLSMISPMVDEHFKLKKRGQDIEFLRIQQHTQRMPPVAQHTPPPTQQEPINDEAVNFFLEKIHVWIESFQQEDPETHSELVQIYNSAANMDNFFDQIKEYDIDLFNDLTGFLNGTQQETDQE
jgi:hypothetical protein